MDVRMPDGTIIRNVPDGTPKEAILARYERRSSGVLGKVDAAVRGAADTITFGLADELAAGLAVPFRAASDAVKGRGVDLGRAYNEGLATERAIDSADSVNSPVARGVGQVAGAIVGPGAAMGTGARVLPRVAGAAAYGGAYGFGSGEGGFQNRAVNAAKGAALNAVGNEAGRALVRGGSAVLRGAQELPAAARLRQAGVEMTVGQRAGGRIKNFEDRIAGIGGVGGPVREAQRTSQETAMRAMANQGLEPIGGTISAAATTGRDIASEALTQAGGAMDNAVRRMSLTLDTPFAVQAAKLRENPEVAGLIDDEILPRLTDDVLDGRSVQEVKEVLDSEVRKWNNVPGGRRTAQSLRAFRETLLGAVQRQAPEVAADYRKARQAYGAAKTVAKASEKNLKDGLATPQQLAQAVREGARRFGPKDAFSQKLAPLQDFTDDAASVLPSSIKDPGTAGQLAFLGGLGLTGGAATMFGAPPEYAAIPLALGLASKGIYTPAGQRAVGGMLFNRPGMVRQAGNRLGQLAAPLGVGTGAFLIGE